MLRWILGSTLLILGGLVVVGVLCFWLIGHVLSVADDDWGGWE